MSQGAIQKITVASFFWNTVYTTFQYVMKSILSVLCVVIRTAVCTVAVFFGVFWQAALHSMCKKDWLLCISCLLVYVQVRMYELCWVCCHCVVSLQTLNEVLTAGNTEQAQQAFLTQVFVCLLYWRQRSSIKGAVPQSSGVLRWMKRGRGQWVVFLGWGQCFLCPSMLWQFWLGDRKGQGGSANQKQLFLFQSRGRKPRVSDWDSPVKQPLK